jgi:tetratricopeptide (TPR) repeat protein
MAYLSGFFDEDREVTRLAQMYLFQEIPYSAGLLMEKHLGDGIVEKTGKNYELQGNAWMLAQELGRALEPLELAAKESDEGKLYLRLGQIHIDAERWKEADRALRRAIEKGGLKNTGNAHLLRGIALYNLKNKKAARAQFRLARKHERTEKAAGQWMRVLDQETEAGE